MINKKILIIVVSLVSLIHFSFLLIRHSSLDLSLWENIIFSLTFVITYFLLFYLPLALFFYIKSKKRYFIILFVFIVLAFISNVVYKNIKMYQTRDDLKRSIVRLDISAKKDMFVSECENRSVSIDLSVCDCVDYDYKNKKYKDTRLYPAKLDQFSFLEEYYKIYPDEKINNQFCKDSNNNCRVDSKKAILEYEKYKESYLDRQGMFCNNYYLEKFGQKSLDKIILKHGLSKINSFNLFALFYAGAM